MPEIVATQSEKERSMHYPVFFNEVRKIVLHDPLAEFLGAAEGGVVEYGYADAVKLAGHSCPTVAGAYLMTLRVLVRLYGGQRPERGALRVDFRDDLASGVTGVMANIVSLITGATQDGGFKGIAGRFERRNLLFFNAAIEGEVRFRRVDTGAAVEASYRPEIVPPAPAMQGLMPKAVSGTASTEELREFGALWQDRVRRILIEHVDNGELVLLRDSHGPE